MATSADFDSIVAPHYRAEGPGAAVAVRHRGELIHVRGYGLANVEWDIPIDANTVFRIGSITKQFTAAAILKLAEGGALDIDDPIERHLADYPVGDRRITIRHLLNHTSGIKSVTGLPNWPLLMNQELPLAQMIDVFKGLPLDFEPGERFLYNNSAYILLGAIIAQVSGQDYGAFLHDAFFAPLGLTSTTYLHDRPLTRRRAAGYEMQDGELVNAAPMSMNWPHGAGALGSTVNDLLRWEEALRTGRVVSPASYAAMTTPTHTSKNGIVNYGFGLRVETYRGRLHIGHAGGINGFVTNLLHWPDDDLTVVVLSNLLQFPIQQVTYGLARRALELADTVRSPATLDDSRLDRCAGVFRFDAGPIRLRADAGVLAAEWPRPGSRFRPEGEDAFYLESDPEVALRFSELGDGGFGMLLVEGYGDPITGRRAAKTSDQVVG